MARNNTNSIIISILGAKPIAFNPELARISGSAAAGLFMSQLLYWWGKGRNRDCIYKTIEEFKNETCLTRCEQATAIKKWRKLGVLVVKNKGVPQKRHFYLNTDKLVAILQGVASDKGIVGYTQSESGIWRVENETKQTRLQDTAN